MTPTPVFTIPMLATVKHIASSSDHDRWHGVVVERSFTERPGETSTIYMIRWIKPQGDPSEGLTGHAAAELVVIQPPAPPVPGGVA